MICAVITFPGSNCDHDALDSIGRVLGYEVRNVFHKERMLDPCDAVVIPGGFSYGDYLRAGALAKLSPIMDDVRRFARHGGLVIGICNGFQILCEAGLLPGALIRNRSLKFVSRVVSLCVENNGTAFTSEYSLGQTLRIPIAHAEGCYVADPATIEALESEGRIVFRYSGPVRPDVPDGNPNGSTRGIAGIVNEEGNVLGLMPHPERACDPLVGLTDGAAVFHSMACHIRRSPRSNPSPAAISPSVHS
ncbi:phosphoribosylformylglycinamidine synthase subunit PurQ [bacterium]|nr:phosphoribosylformylglycinamidine synthase subunit PurQ [bacterium]MBU1983399.1 phosphoribosylformylglycinamidine synthase subunit PurQ [bacterium]